ncbi:restriction endonuclease subunit S [Streptococcus sp. OMI870]|uniref:restriction endonuclease subunit S n=1 Tax=Streptococcus sp. OMI870 TaxID=3047018 RepID=UPI0039C02686
MGNKKIPKIRFNNSKIDWQKVKFKNLLNSEEGIRRGPFGSALKKELFVPNSEYVVYEQQNAIYDHFNTRYRILEEKYRELKKFMLLPGDFIMSGAGTIGKISLVPEGIEKGVFNQALIRLRVNKNIDKEFFLQWMRSPEMQNKLTKANPASAMVNLVPMSEVKEWDVIVPSLEEQSAIGTLFRTLDDLLASYKDNLTNYQSLKATMLAKMFPKAGQTVPEIRIEGFEGEWEKLKLRDVVHTNPKSELPENFKYIDLESVVGTRINKIREERKESAPSRAQRLAKKGDVFYQTVRPYQKNNYLFKLDEIDYVFSTGYAQLRPIFKRCDSDFLLILLQNNRFLSKVLDRCTGTSYPAINVNDLIEILIAIPSYDEQQAIGSYFSNLDNLIAAHQEKISQLETLKKKLLQDMFI